MRLSLSEPLLDVRKIHWAILLHEIKRSINEPRMAVYADAYDQLKVKMRLSSQVQPACCEGEDEASVENDSLYRMEFARIGGFQWKEAWMKGMFEEKKERIHLSS